MSERRGGRQPTRTLMLSPGEAVGNPSFLPASLRAARPLIPQLIREEVLSHPLLTERFWLHDLASGSSAFDGDVTITGTVNLNQRIKIYRNLTVASGGILRAGAADLYIIVVTGVLTLAGTIDHSPNGPAGGAGGGGGGGAGGNGAGCLIIYANRIDGNTGSITVNGNAGAAGVAPTSNVDGSAGTNGTLAGQSITGGGPGADGVRIGGAASLFGQRLFLLSRDGQVGNSTGAGGGGGGGADDTGANTTEGGGGGGGGAGAGGGNGGAASTTAAHTGSGGGGGGGGGALWLICGATIPAITIQALGGNGGAGFGAGGGGGGGGGGIVAQLCLSSAAVVTVTGGLGGAAGGTGDSAAGAAGTAGLSFLWQQRA